MADVPDMTVYNEVLQQRLGALEMETVGLTAHMITLNRTIEEQGTLIASQQATIDDLEQRLAEQSLVTREDPVPN